MNPQTLELLAEFLGAMASAYWGGELAGDLIDRLDEWADENGLSNDEVMDMIDHLFDEPFGSNVGDFSAGGDMIV